MQSAASEPPLYFNFATDVFDKWTENRPDAKALWHVDPNSGAEARLSFSQLSNLSERAAALFVSQGIRPGDRVLLMLPRIPQWWISMLGLIRMGAVPVPATLLLTDRELAYRIERGGVRAAITSPEGVAKMDGFGGIKLLVGGGCKDWTDFDRGMAAATGESKSHKTLSSAPGILFFTSATTGEPKMVLHTQASYGMGHRITGELWLDLKPDDVHWNVSDLGWGKAAWSSFFGPWHMGACIFALDARAKFDPALTLETLSHYPITTACVPPTALRLIVRQNLAKWQFPKLRHFVTAGEPLNPEVLSLWRGATGLTIHEGYGQTETVVMIANCKSLGYPVKAGSMGKSVPGMGVTLVDEDLREVPAGQEGEVAIQVSPRRPLGLFQEYLNNPEEMKRKFNGGFYRTGDRAMRDEDGYFWFIGRNDDVIKSSGYRIGPFEVESAMLEHPSVLDVAVVGKPDVLRGQVVKAFVVARPGYAADESLKVELQQHCKKLVAAYKYPREIEFVPELPKTTSGKTRHAELRRASSETGTRKV